MSDPRFPEPGLREEFRRELRMKLMAEAQTVLIPRGRRGTAWTFLRPLAAVGLAVLVLIGSAGTAAAGSLPGDPGFGLKRAFEELQLTLTLDDVDRLELLAQLTDRRLQELEQVAENAAKAPTASEEYAAAVARFRAAVDALQQAAPQEKKDWAQDVADSARDKHEAIIERLRERVPEKAKQALDRARNEEERDTPERKKQKDRDDDDEDEDSMPRPERTSEPARTPGATPRVTEGPERTATPRTTTPRPSATPRATDHHDDD